MAEAGFPESFWWGTAASSPQTEGAAPASNWLDWEGQGRVPPSGDGNGFARRHRQDFELYASYGLTHHRLGIEWARLEPEPGRRDPAAVEHYRRILEAARSAGIEPWVCLHHFVLPRWTAALGFADPSIQEPWRRHVEFVAETFGDLVTGWQPVNEPIAYALAGFLTERHPPGLSDRGLMQQALEGIHVAAYEAARILRQTARPVATINALVPLFAAGEASADARDWLDRAIWGCWISAFRDGVLRVPGREPVRLAGYPEAFDLVGFSYYFAASVTPGGGLGVYPPEGTPGPMGYVPWSDGLGLVLDRLAAELPGRPLLIAEHGVGTHDDGQRCDVLRRSLGLVADRLRAGMDIRGFFHWTGVDNYEWGRGFEVPFGLFDRERVARPSAELLRDYATSRQPLGT